MSSGTASLACDALSALSSHCGLALGVTAEGVASSTYNFMWCFDWACLTRSQAEVNFNLHWPHMNVVGSDVTVFAEASWHCGRP